MTTAISKADVQPWVKPHVLQVFKQVERRPDKGSGWMETQGTGLVHLLCNCGYSTGWISREQVPNSEELAAEHEKPLASVMT
jgi:hypothetical protein